MYSNSQFSKCLSGLTAELASEETGIWNTLKIKTQQIL